jgi:hypothetical protein
VPQAATPPDIGKMSVEDRLKLVVESAASRPGATHENWWHS